MRLLSRVRRSVVALLVGAVAAGGCGSDEGAVCPACPEPEAPPTPKVAPAPASADRDSVPVDRPRELEFMGFATDGRHFALRVQDAAIGRSFQVMEVASGKVVKTYVYTAFDEKTTWRRAKRKHGLQEATASSQKLPDEELMLLGGDDDAWVVIYIMKGERAVPYFRIPRLSGDDDVPSNVSVKTIAWDPSGRHAVVVHSQKLARTLPFESDYVHTFEVDKRRLPFD